MPTLANTLENCFRPAIAMDNPRLFAGREEEVMELVQALQTDGACPLIYGERGLGKTSLALQGERIAKGERDLLGKYDRLDYALTGDDRFFPVYVSCTSETTTASEVCDLLTDAISELLLGQDRGKSPLIEKSRRVKLGVKPIELEQISKFGPKEAPHPAPPIDAYQRLLSVVSTLFEVVGRRILLIVDELDLVSDTSGLASFIRAHSSPSLKFVLVGIGDHVSSLLSDHRSLERICVPIEVPPMNDGELLGIITEAASFLDNYSIDLSFAAAAKQELLACAAGFPWFIHVLGQGALRHAHKRMVAERATGRYILVVEQPDILRSLRTLVTGRFAQQFAATYATAVAGSRHREIVLRLFALWPGRELPVSRIHRVLRDEFGIAQPGHYKAQLSREKYGSVLLPSAGGAGEFVRFENAMFKIYARLRPPIHNGLENEVRDALEKRGLTVPRLVRTLAP